MKTALLLVLLAGCGSVTASSADAGVDVAGELLEAGNTGAAGAAADAALEHGNTGVSGGPAGSSGAAGATADAGTEHPATLQSCAGTFSCRCHPEASCSSCAGGPIVTGTITQGEWNCLLVMDCVANGQGTVQSCIQSGSDQSTTQACVDRLFSQVCPGLGS